MKDKSLKELLTDISVWLAARKSQTVKVIDYQLANANVMTFLGGSAVAWHLYGDMYIVAFTLGVRTTQSRTDMAAIRIVMDGKVVRPYNPYFFPCFVNGVANMSFTNNSSYWFPAPGNWAANTDFRVSGMGLMEKTTISI